jgi:uncharacterized membrane protein YeiB
MSDLQLYGLAYDGYAELPKRNFSTLHQSFLTVFQLLIGDGLSVIMYQTLAVTSEWSFLYFATWLMLGQWIFLNMFLALLMDGFDENDPVMHDQVSRFLDMFTGLLFMNMYCTVYFGAGTQR